MSACSAAAKSEPVRPNPVAISSSTSGTPCSSQSERSSATHSGGWNRIPPAPCTIGSTITPASSCSSNSERTDNSHSGVHSGSGAKTCSASVPFHIECIPPSGSHTAIAPKVSPW